MKVSDQEIVTAIRENKDERVLDSLYKIVFPKVKVLITKNSGTADDAFDIFQEAVIIFYQQVKLNKYKTEYAIAGYIYSVARNLWIDEAKRRKKYIHVSEKEGDVPIEEGILSALITKEKAEALDQILSHLGDKCKKLLTLSVFEKRSMKEICEEIGLANENAAKTQNYKCKQKLIELIKGSPSIQKLFEHGT